MSIYCNLLRKTLFPNYLEIQVYVYNFTTYPQILTFILQRISSVDWIMAGSNPVQALIIYIFDSSHFMMTFGAPKGIGSSSL